MPNQIAMLSSRVTLNGRPVSREPPAGVGMGRGRFLRPAMRSGYGSRKSAEFSHTLAEPTEANANSGLTRA